MIGAAPFPHPAYRGARPFWASLRAIVPLLPFNDGILMLDLVAHEHCPDAEGIFPAGDAVMIERGVRFIWHRGEVYNELPFGVSFAPGEKLLPFISARLGDGTVVAVGGVRPAPGNYSDRSIHAGAASITLAVQRSH